jgi:hypothetical protein
MDDLARAASGGFLQLLTEDIHRCNHSTGRLMQRRQCWPIPGQEKTQLHRASAQRVKSLETFQEPLACVNSSQPSCATEAIRVCREFYI